MKAEKIEKEYEKYIKRRENFIMITLFSIILFIIVGLTFGSVEISFLEIVEVLLGGGNRTYGIIIWRLRMPRVLSALLAGMALALAGVSLQSLLRNPLASQYTLGLSHAAVFGVAFAIIILGAGTLHSSSTDAVIINNPYIVTISAFISCLLCTLIIILIMRFKNAKPQTIILSGIILSSLFMALTTSLQYFASDVQLASIIFWTFGDLSKSTWTDFFILAVIVSLSFIFFMRNAWNYNVLNTGDETAESLGVNGDKVRITGMVVASLTIAVVVSFFGIIGFVGLVVPHIVRRIIGGDEKYLIPASALFGGVFLLIADTIARTIISPIVLPVGILTSFIGAPLFLYLLLKKEDRGYW